MDFKRRLRITLWVMGVIAALGIGLRIIEYFFLVYATEKQSVLAVATTKATPAPQTVDVTLPSNVVAWHETTIYARTNGYVVNWFVDIGAHVKQGDLLAAIATPEVSAELNQAEADLKTAEENSHLADTTAARWVKLLKTESVSKQETDERVSDAKAKAAIVVSARANRDRLYDLVSFQRVVAPFDGIIMSRTTDIGRLINAGSNGTVPLFRMVQANRLRVYVKVPEYYSSSINPQLKAALRFTEHPGKTYSAALLDTAKAIDLTTRTLLVQLAMDNTNEEILPGSYAQVTLTMPTNKTIVQLPVNALMFRSEGLQVAIIDGDHKAFLKSITMGHDFGDTVEVTSGLKPGDTVIVNPPDSLISGQQVSIVEPTA